MESPVTLTFLDPTSTVTVEPVPAFPVGTLTSTRVALIDNSKENAGYLLDEVSRRRLERECEEVVELRDRLAEREQAVATMLEQAFEEDSSSDFRPVAWQQL